MSLFLSFMSVITLLASQPLGLFEALEVSGFSILLVFSTLVIIMVLVKVMSAVLGMFDNGDSQKK